MGPSDTIQGSSLYKVAFENLLFRLGSEFGKVLKGGSIIDLPVGWMLKPD